VVTLQEAKAAFDVASLITSLSATVSPGDVLTLIGTCVGAGMGFVLAWFGARKVVRAFTGALKKGKVSV
jgi:ABC-type uncharacterized transport system YnjBCD ATPase subunit